MQTSVSAMKHYAERKLTHAIYHLSTVNKKKYFIFIFWRKKYCARSTCDLECECEWKFRSWPTWWQNFYRRSFFILCTAHTKWIARRVQCWCTTNKWMMTVVDGDSRMVCNWWLCQLYVFYVIKILVEKSTHIHEHTNTHTRTRTLTHAEHSRLSQNE